MAALAEGNLKNLVVFDFDWSLCDANTDTWLLEQLHSPLLARSHSLWADHYTHSSSWAEFMDYLMGLIHDEGHQRSAIDEAVCSLPIRPAMVEAIKLCSAHGCELVINSGCNAYFIDLVLKHYGIRECFSAIHTHKAHWCTTSGRLRIRPYHIRSNTPPSPLVATGCCDAIHGHHPDDTNTYTPCVNISKDADMDTIEEHACEQCPDDLCKGAIMNKYLQAGRYRTVIYLGDSTNDFCPCTRLSRNDHVLARKGYNLNVLLQQQQQQQQDEKVGNKATEPSGYGDVPSRTGTRPPVIANVHLWDSYDDVLHAIQNILVS